MPFLHPTVTSLLVNEVSATWDYQFAGKRLDFTRKKIARTYKT